MHAAGFYFAAVAGVVHVLGKEDRIRIAGAERLELLEDAEEFRGDLREIQPGVDVHDRGEFLLGDIAGDEGVHPPAELFQVLLLHREAGGIHMAAEVLQEVRAALDGGIQVESGDAAGRSGDEPVGLGENDRGLVIGLHEAGSNDAHDALVPGGIVNYGHVLRLQGGAVPTISMASWVISRSMLLRSLLLSLIFSPIWMAEPVVGRGEKFHRQTAGLHAAGGIDAGTDLEDDVIDSDVPGLELGQVDHGQKALAGIFVEPFEAEVGQDAVLPHHGHKVGSDAHHQQVQEGSRVSKSILYFCEYACTNLKPTPQPQRSSNG